MVWLYGMNLLRAMIMWYDYILVEAIFILCGIIDTVISSESIKTFTSPATLYYVSKG